MERTLPRPLAIDWAHVLLAVSIALIVARWAWFVVHPWIIDSYGYWLTREGPLYDIPWLDKYAFVYSPAFAQATAPLTVLPFLAFYAAWMALNIGALVYLAGPVLSAALLWAYHPVWGDNVAGGNIYILLGLAVALAVRYPAAWAFPVLTKVTPGVGAAWHLGRREWRAFAIAVGATLAITAVSAILAPAAWAEWIGLLLDNAGGNPSGVPLSIRLPLALGLAVLAGWKGWIYALPFAVVIAMPQVGWSATPVLLACVYWIRSRP